MQSWNFIAIAATSAPSPSASKAPQQRGTGRRGIVDLLRRTCLLAAVLLVAACATPGAPPADDGPGSTAQRELAAGVELFDKGDYVAAIRVLLKSDEIWRASLQTRVTAQKYVAFSHCLSNRPEPCLQSFRDLLRMKPDFELAAAEVGHPQWGPAFRQARRDTTGAGIPASASTALARASR